LGEAEKLYETIKSRNLATYTSSRCYSACTIAFIAGHERWLKQNAKLGFHAPAFPGMSREELQGATEGQRRLMLAAGYSHLLYIPRADYRQQFDVVPPGRGVAEIERGHGNS
jgi:hypothetical protein